MTTYLGRCHCGALSFEYTTAIPPAEWSVRACQCSFCRAHAALSTSDPRGEVRFHAAAADRVARYRFGLRSADFLVCRECGVYVGAITTIGKRTLEARTLEERTREERTLEERTLAVLNVNALATIPQALPAPRPMSYDGETNEERARRRGERWTPARLEVGGAQSP